MRATDNAESTPQTPHEISLENAFDENLNVLNRRLMFDDYSMSSGGSITTKTKACGEKIASDRNKDESERRTPPISPRSSGINRLANSADKSKRRRQNVIVDSPLLGAARQSVLVRLTF